MRNSKNSLIGKTVMSGRGVQVGIVKKSLIDTKSGKITSLLITPSHKIDPEEYKQNKEGEIVLPIDSISQVQDIVVFEKNNCL